MQNPRDLEFDEMEAWLGTQVRELFASKIALKIFYFSKKSQPNARLMFSEVDTQLLNGYCFVLMECEQFSVQLTSSTFVKNSI